jgi:hypothetical protein
LEQSDLPRLLLDQGVTAVEESVLAGQSPVPALVLEVEATPNTTAMERHKVALINRLGPLLASKRLPSEHVVLALSCLLGAGLKSKFAPLWPVATKVLAAAAEVYPRTLWALLSRQLLRASVDRGASAPIDDATGDTAEALAPTPASDGPKSRSQARSEAANARLQRLRASQGAVSALAHQMADPSESVTESPHRSDALERTDRVLRTGLVGAESYLSSTVMPPVASKRRRGDFGGEAPVVTHINDATVIGLGAGAGSVDAETNHRLLTGVLAAAPAWAEGRTRTLVPLVLAFLRDDYFTLASNTATSNIVGGDDPDATELQLATALKSLYARHKTSTERRSTANSASDATTAAASKGGSSKDDAEALLQSLAQSATLVTTPLPRSAATGRLLNFLRVLQVRSMIQ